MARGLIVLVAFLALQATCNAALSLSPKALLQQIEDQATALRKQIDTTIANIEENVFNNTDTTVAKIHDDIQQVAQNVRGQVEAAVAEVKAAGMTAEECTEKITSTVEEVMSNITEFAENCVATQVKDGESLITDLVNNNNVVNDTLENLHDQLTKCNSNFLTAATCTIGVLTSAATSVSSDSARVVSDVTKGAALVAGFQMNVNSCETSVFQSIPTRVQDAVSNLASCYTSS